MTLQAVILAVDETLADTGQLPRRAFHWTFAAHGRDRKLLQATGGKQRIVHDRAQRGPAWSALRPILRAIPSPGDCTPTEDFTPVASGEALERLLEAKA